VQSYKSTGVLLLSTATITPNPTKSVLVTVLRRSFQLPGELEHLLQAVSLQAEGLSPRPGLDSRASGNDMQMADR
jgi:hypothetical protein